MNEHRGWIGVDLDQTLAYYDIWISMEHIGEPIPEMLKKVKAKLAEGVEVKIFTARAQMKQAIPIVKEWCIKHGLGDLDVTNVKDMNCVEIWDDRARQVIANRGIFVE